VIGNNGSCSGGAGKARARLMVERNSIVIAEANKALETAYHEANMGE
jgi:hypothetical protein